MANSAVPKREVFTFNWKIENFSFCCHAVAEALYSPEFVTELFGRARWKIVLYPRGDSEGSAVSCFLLRCDSNEKTIELGTKYSILSCDGSPNISRECPRTKFSSNQNFGLKRFGERSELFRKRNSFLPADTLTVQLQMWSSGCEPYSAQLTVSVKDAIRDVFCGRTFDTELTDEEYSALESEMKRKVQMSPTECTARTKMLVQRIRFYWAVDFSEANFATRLIVNQGSPALLISVRLDPGKTNVSVKIRKVNKNNPASSSMTCKLTISNSIGEILQVLNEYYWFAKEPDRDTCNFSPISFEILRKDPCPDNNTLNLEFDVVVSRQIVQLGIEECSSVQTDSKELTFEMSKGVEDRIVKVILPPFGKNDSQSDRNIGAPNDDSADNFHTMVMNIYRHQVHVDVKSLIKTYEAADSHPQISSEQKSIIKKDCVDLLSQKIGKGCAVHIMAFADLNAEIELRETAKTFILNKHLNERPSATFGKYFKFGKK